MRKAIVVLSLAGFALAANAGIDTAAAAPAKMSKMGCMIGKQKWDASAGKCVDAKPVAKAMSKAKAKPAPKKAM